MKWRILNSSYPFLSNWLTVRKDKVKMPTGHEIDDFYVLEYPNWVNVIAITQTGLFVIEKQYRHGLQKICYELCAGCVEDNESPIEAAKRELLEETGYAGGNWKEFMISSPNPNTMNNLCYTFLAEGVKRVTDPKQEESEDINIHLLSEDMVKEKLINGSIIEGIMQASLWSYLFKNNNYGI